MNKSRFLTVVLAVGMSLPVYAQLFDGSDAAAFCKELPTHSQLQTALAAARAQ